VGPPAKFNPQYALSIPARNSTNLSILFYAKMKFISKYLEILRIKKCRTCC